jgi:hypothetical protein
VGSPLCRPNWSVWCVGCVGFSFSTHFFPFHPGELCPVTYRAVVHCPENEERKKQIEKINREEEYKRRSWKDRK